MAEHNDPAAHSQCLGRTHVFEITRPQKLGPHHTHKAHPREQQQQAQQPPEIGFDHARQNDQQVQSGQSRPDLDKALRQQVGPTTEVALHGTSGNADDGTDYGQYKAKQHRDTKPIDRTRQHIAGLIIGAEPVLKIRRGRCRYRQVPGDRLMVIADGRPQHPALGIDQFGKIGITVIGFGQKVAAEGGFRISFKNRGVDLAIVDHDKGLVVGDELGKKRDREQNQENPQ